VYGHQSLGMNMMMNMIECCHLSSVNRNSDHSGNDDDHDDDDEGYDYVYTCCV